MRLQFRDPSITSPDELLTEFDLCIGLLFKPLRHHLNEIVESEGNFSSIWKSVLKVLEDFSHSRDSDDNGEERREVISAKLKSTMAMHMHEHLQNTVIFLMSAGVLLAESSSPGDITSLTWDAASRMGISEESLQEWKNRAANETSKDLVDGVASHDPSATGDVAI